MTKQKFYEECILKSYEHSDEDSAYSNEVVKLRQLIDWPPKSFSQLLLKRAMCGFAEINPKQMFDKLGFEYLAQVTGFVVHCNDYEFTCDYFEFLKTLAKSKSCKKILDVKDENQTDVLFEFYFETLTGQYHDWTFCEKMADFILLNCEGTKAYDKVLKLSYAFGRTSIGYSDLFEMKRKAMSGIIA